jgi:hypothetical protein
MNILCSEGLKQNALTNKCFKHARLSNLLGLLAHDRISGGLTAFVFHKLQGISWLVDQPQVFTVESGVDFGSGLR